MTADTRPVVFRLPVFLKSNVVLGKAFPLCGNLPSFRVAAVAASRHTTSRFQIPRLSDIECCSWKSITIFFEGVILTLDANSESLTIFCIQIESSPPPAP